MAGSAAHSVRTQRFFATVVGLQHHAWRREREMIIANLDAHGLKQVDCLLVRKGEWVDDSGRACPSTWFFFPLFLGLTMAVQTSKCCLTVECWAC